MHRAYPRSTKPRKSLMQQRELADLRFLVSEETAVADDQAIAARLVEWSLQR
jgi:hypothetical protein